jgi:hypothetical protein
MFRRGRWSSSVVDSSDLQLFQQIAFFVFPKLEDVEIGPNELRRLEIDSPTDLGFHLLKYSVDRHEFAWPVVDVDTVHPFGHPVTHHIPHQEQDVGWHVCAKIRAHDAIHFPHNTLQLDTSQGTSDEFHSMSCNAALTEEPKEELQLQEDYIEVKENRNICKLMTKRENT